MTTRSSNINMRSSEGRKRYGTQFLSALVVSLGPFAAGLGKGYTSPALASLQSNSSSSQNVSMEDIFTVSQTEASWIASLSFLGAVFGGILGGATMRLGRRKVLLFISLPFSMTWVLTKYAQSASMLMATSMSAGFLCAIISMVSQVYISEISVPEVRGCLSSLLKILNQLGVLITFTAGAYLDWKNLAFVVAAAPLLLFLSILFLPETPSFLCLRNKDQEALKSLQWLRGENADVRQELTTIRTNIQANRLTSEARNCFSREIFNARLMRPVLITCGLMLFQRFSGAQSFTSYAVPIFTKTFGEINPHSVAISMSAVQILASCLSGLLIDKVGRLPLLISSGVLMSSALFAYGFCINLKTGFNDGQYDSISLVCILVFTIAFSLGISPISWLLIAELFPLEYRDLGSSLATTFSYFCAFLSLKSFTTFEATFGLDGTFWIYSFISIIGLCFVLAFVPETKGKEMDEMNSKYLESICINKENDTITRC